MRRLLGTATVVALASVAGCGLQPPAELAPRNAAPVAASFAKTWDAVIDVFAEQRISIETMDRSSGFIVPRSRAELLESDTRFYDCGKNGFGHPWQAGSVKYNVIVRGDSSHATVQVRAFFDPKSDVAAVVRCNSTGVYESETEQMIRARAERR